MSGQADIVKALREQEQLGSIGSLREIPVPGETKKSDGSGWYNLLQRKSYGTRGVAGIPASLICLHAKP